MEKKKVYISIIAFGIALFFCLLCLFSNCQPQNNICDQVAFANATTYPLQPTGLSFDVGSKTLHISHSDTPNAFQIKRFYAWEQPGGGYVEFDIWGGLICSDSFYDYYLLNGNALQDEIEYFIDIQFARRNNGNTRGNNKGYIRYEVYATNDANFLNSPVISTGYFQP